MGSKYSNYKYIVRIAQMNLLFSEGIFFPGYFPKGARAFLQNSVQLTDGTSLFHKQDLYFLVLGRLKARAF